MWPDSRPQVGMPPSLISALVLTPQYPKGTMAATMTGVDQPTGLTLLMSLRPNRPLCSMPGAFAPQMGKIGWQPQQTVADPYLETLEVQPQSRPQPGAQVGWQRVDRGGLQDPQPALPP